MQILRQDIHLNDDLYCDLIADVPPTVFYRAEQSICIRENRRMVQFSRSQSLLDTDWGRPPSCDCLDYSMSGMQIVKFQDLRINLGILLLPRFFLFFTLLSTFLSFIYQANQIRCCSNIPTIAQHLALLMNSSNLLLRDVRSSSCLVLAVNGCRPRPWGVKSMHNMR